MTDRELFEKALEALEWWEAEFGGNEAPEPAITALRERLAQPEQEPVAWANKDDLQNFDMRVRTNCDLMHTAPLYTAPPQRKPLTDEEIDAEWRELDGEASPLFKCVIRKFARAIEAKIKEKNT